MDNGVVGQTVRKLIFRSVYRSVIVNIHSIDAICSGIKLVSPSFRTVWGGNKFVNLNMLKELLIGMV